MSALAPASARPGVAAAEAAARRELRRQIARLEARLERPARIGGAPGPQLLGLAELTACRDALVAAGAREREERRHEADAVEHNRVLLERALLHPERHRGLRMPLAALGQPGCGVYQVRPRLGLIGRLAGWWEVKLSSGCPLAMHEDRHDRSERDGRDGHLERRVAPPRVPLPAPVIRHRR